MSEPYIGEIVMFAGNFAPRGWQLCQGQLLSIAQNSALFSILGTTYGGDGVTTFALPDLRSRVPVQQGQGPGLSQYVLGEAAGTENVTLLTSQMPAHTHLPLGFNGTADQTTPGNNIPATTNNPTDRSDLPAYVAASQANAPMAPVSSAGGSQPFSVLQPFLALNFIIAIEGIFPSRN